MDDFEYSVAISDRDWEFFFTECEECNLLPPSLAGVDDSGMSDIDDHYLTQKVRRANSTIGFSENDHPIDSPPHRAGSPVEHSFGKQGIGGIDSVLSGSEEDIHMQSINMFFEKLKGLTEVQPSQERTGNNKEAVQEGGCCDDGQQAIKRSLPKNSSKLNMLPERGETGGGRVTVGSVDTSRPDTIKIVADESSFSSRTSVFSGYKSDISIKKSFGNELEQLNQYLHSTERLAWSEMTPQSFKVEMGQSMDDNYQESLLTSQEIQNKKCRRSEDHVFTRETSPSISMRRKRKKKRRSMEVDDEEACERRGLIKQGGWKEELPLLREGASLCSSQETLDYLTEPQKSHMNLCTRNPPNINFLKNLTAQGVKTELQHSVSPSDIQNQNFLQKTFTAVSSAGKYSAKLRSEPDPSQSEDNVTSAATDCANEATSLQPCSKIQVEESDGRNQYSKLPVSVIKKSRSQQQDVKAGDHEQSEQIKTSVGDCNNKQNLKCSTAEVKPVSRLSNAESCAPAGEVSQKDNLSAAKLVLAVEAGKAGRDERTLCQSEAESQQQLEKDCHNTNQCHNILENTHCPVAATDKISSHSRACASQQEISGDVTCSDLTSDCIYQIPESYLSNSLSRAGTEKQTCCLIEVLDSGTALTSQNLENKVHRTQNTEPTNRNSDENHTANEQESVQAGKQMLIVVTSEHTNQTESNTMKLGSDRDQTIAAYREPEKDVNSVFAMSSFWNEMEKLTINDILGLRKESLTAPPGSLPPVQEHEETQLFPVANHVSESKLEQIPEKISDSSTLRSVSWECEPVPVSRVSIIYPVSPVLTSVPDSSQPARTEGAQNCLRKISKTVSVHNLQALESESFRYTNETRQILEKQEPEIIDSLPENVASKKENEANLQPSSSESYSISFMDIFQYLFGGKESVSSQSATDEKTTSFTSGNSVPETYDHFFSEFDSENFFYPLIAAEETNKDQMVPIFSCSRSTCRNLQFPEAYEHFFASSSSDDSSAESEEEDNCSHVRVVSRFTRTASLSQFSKDMYEEFFTDKDLQENFFSLKSLSFRKINFTAPTVQNQGSNSLVPVRQTPRYTLKMCSRLNVLGNQDMMFPDPLLDHLEDRISYQLAQQPFTYEDLQSTISNPRLESPFLPLKQSDMCLVCIAFASWVLKTTNPQVGDAWKAVLLANVSALSAIRYLRKYVKTEAASSEIKPHLKALKDS